MGTTHEETRYTCNQCKYNSTQETNLKKHIETTHDETRYTCNQCEYKFDEEENLKKHEENSHKVKTVNSIKGEPNLCKRSIKTFINRPKGDFSQVTGVGQNILNFKAKTCDNDKHKNNKRKFNSIEKEASNIESPYKRPNIKSRDMV